MRIAIAEEMVKYMMEKRKVEIKDLIVEYSTTQVLIKALNVGD